MVDRKRNKAVFSAKGKELLRSVRKTDTITPYSYSEPRHHCVWNGRIGYRGGVGKCQELDNLLAAIKHQQSINNTSTKFYVFPPVLLRKEQADAKNIPLCSPPLIQRMSRALAQS